MTAEAKQCCGKWVDFTNGNSFARVAQRESSFDAARAAQEGQT